MEKLSKETLREHKNARQRKYAENNKEKIRARQKRWYKAQYQKWYKKNRDRVIENSKKWKEKNPEKVKQARQKWYLEKRPVYYEKNKKEINKKDWERRKKNPAKLAEKGRRWRDNHEDYYNQRHHKKYPNDIQYRLRCILRSRLFSAVNGNYKNCSAVRDLGCTIPELKSYLESKFQEGMGWENYGKWHIDHINPLSSFDLTDSKQTLKALSYKNLQPLWAKDNLQKGAKIIGLNSYPQQQIKVLDNEQARV